MEDKTVYIAVIGDSGVGKTSLITAAATETFPDHPPPVLPPARLPAETTPEAVPLVITDTSSRPEDRQALEAACQQASVIVLCFALDKQQTLKRVTSYWMPELRRLGVHVPVMLVGCKSDIRPADQTLHQAVLPIVRSHKEIETCMECSAKKLQFVGEVFYYALKSVIHPMAPLYDPERTELKPLAARALRRIFHLCDKDNDGVLSDAELNAFQVACFNAPLQPEELVGVKEVVSQGVKEGIRDGGLTLEGFVYLHALFIERGRLETTWAVLRRFGYANTLRLSDELLSRVNFAHTPDQVVELTEAGRQFFRDVFERYDLDDDNVLSPREYEELFATAPADPWRGPEYEGLLVERSRKGHLTLNGFLAKWAYTTLGDPRLTLEYALYLGYPDEQSVDRLFQISKPRRLERRGDPVGRSVLQCYVFGSEGLDTSSLLEGLIAQSRAAFGRPEGPLSVAVANVANPDGSSTTLVMKTFSEEQASVLLSSPARKEELQRCDVGAFVFDGTYPDTFRVAVSQMEAVASASGDCLPCLLVAANDSGMPAELVAEINEACSTLAVRTPAAYSRGAAALYQTLIHLAQQPDHAIPETATLKATRQYRRMLRRGLIGAGVVTTGALAGYLIYRSYKARSAAPGGSCGSTAGGGGSGSGVAGGTAATAVQGRS
ncbi:hypothetical protein N2152v2_010194 [Parachlorella kessleri]